MEEIYDKVLDRLRVLCSRKEYCSGDMLKKAAEYLSRYGCPPESVPEMAASLLDSLCKDRYVDDLRYAAAFARDKAALTGWGTVKIRYALASKGIGPDVIQEALRSINRDQAGSRLYRLLEVKRKALKDDPQSRLKMLKFALGRGYGYEEAESAIKRLIESARTSE